MDEFTIYLKNKKISKRLARLDMQGRTMFTSHIKIWGCTIVQYPGTCLRNFKTYLWFTLYIQDGTPNSTTFNYS